MGAIGTVLSVAQTLFAALDNAIVKETLNNSVFKETYTALGYKSQLEDLKRSVQTIKSVLVDAAASKELTDAEQHYIEELKAAVYDADDLFDEFRTLAERKQNQLQEGNYLSKKVRLFFSSDNPLRFARKMSREINKIRENLDVIAGNRAKFPSIVSSNALALDNNHIRNRREETCSYVYAPSVIGREADVDSIVEKLLDLNGKEGARFLAVVGIGGMGKTTLAQLVCDDQRVKDGFSSNVWWVCVADEDNSPFDMKTILTKMLESVTGFNHHDSSLEVVQKKLGQELEGQKYLLVLDDVWNEDRVKWMELTDFLTLGAAESRILVTTRSHDVAKAIGNSDIHELKGLSNKNSWRLFEVTAFEQKPDSQIHTLEVEIGKKIVQQCSNVPLAIKVVGSLLCGQGLDKWRSFERSGLGGIGKGYNQIMSILRVSYHNLEPSLKSCFTYCALFPKDYVMKKKMLIRLWTAQGYIVPFDRGQSIEEASEEHFLILLRRCFFQDVKMDEYGNVKSFKMHDLIHDVAQEVSGQEMLVATSKIRCLGAKVRHVFEGSHGRKKNFNSNVKVRSYLRNAPWTHVVDLRLAVDWIFTNGGYLRTLTLKNAGIKSLPDSIGELVHVRYLDLSYNSQLETLPGSITKLYNLQTLTLKGCIKLRELPKKFSRLVNLMHLNIKRCYRIEYMPLGMDKLTSLCELTNFVVADESSSGDNQVGLLKDLKSLVNLKGRIRIKILATVNRAIAINWEGSLFESSERLRKVMISGSHDKAFLEKLLPHRNVNKLELSSYMDVRFPSWGMTDYNWAALLPNLVMITIKECRRLKHFPLVSKLKHLRSLTLDNLDELEYVDSSCPASMGTDSKEEAECTLFPSLEILKITRVPKLKGLWAGVEFSDISNNARLWQRSFPRLSQLIINYRGSFSVKGRYRSREFEVSLGRVEYLKSLPARRVTEIRLCDKEVESLGEVGDVFNNCSSLQRLVLVKCSKLVYVSRELEHLATLESLEIKYCRKLKWEEEGDDNNEGMPWSKLHHSLRFLRLIGIKNSEVLPKAMQYLTSLEKLTISRCSNLEALPEWISCLSSLRGLALNYNKKLKSIPEALRNMRSLKRLVIYRCSDELNERCQQPDGEDWPIIQHIPNFHIG